MRSSTFTTYINTREEPGAYSALDRLAQVATSRYATVTRAANEAARAAAGLRGGIGGAGLGRIGGGTQERDLRALASAQRRVAQASAETSRGLSNGARAAQSYGQSAQQAAQRTTALATALHTTSTALNVVQGPLGPLAGRISALGNAITTLTGVQFGLAGIASVGFALAQAGNAYTTIQSKLRPFYETQQQANVALADIIGIAQRTRAPLETIAGLYGRLAAVGKEVGISARQAAVITEVAGKAAALSGGTAETRQAGLSQFLQGIGSDNLAGDELKSVKENTFVLAQAIARGFENADGSIGTTIGNLKKLGEEGRLTAQAVADALTRSEEQINAQFRRLPLTLSQAATSFGNALSVNVGRIDESIGLTSTLAAAIQAAAENMRGLAIVAGTALTAFAAPGILNTLKSVSTGIRSITIDVLANRAQVRAADQEWVSGLRARLAGHQREQAALRAEAAEIRDNIALLQRRRDVAARDIQRNLPTAYAPGGAYTPGNSAAVQAGAAELRSAIRSQAAEQQRLNVINAALRDSNLRVATSQTALAGATANVASRMSLLRSVGSSLFAFLGGPWGVALTVATGLMIAFASAQSEAEKAIDRNRAAQKDFESQLDLTSGKIRSQIGELERLSLTRRSAATLDDAKSNLSKRGFALQQSILDAITPRSPIGLKRFDLQPAEIKRNQPILQAIVDLRNQRRGSFENLQRIVAERARTDPQLRAALPSIEDRFRDFRTAYSGGTYSDGTSAEFNLRQVAARSRVINGRAAPGDLDLARGLVDPSRPQAETKPLTRAQIAAEAAARAAQTDLQRARAAEAKIRAEGRQSGETDDQYINRLADAKRQVDVLARAEADARKARSAGAVQARREARDARQDADDAAKRRRDGALLDLIKSGQNPDSQAFVQQRQKILKTYDDEVNAINASRAASSSAVEQQLRDAARIQSEAGKFDDLRNNGLAQFSDTPKAVRQADRLIGDLSERLGQFYTDQSGKLVLYTEAQLAADTGLIEEGLRRPFGEYLKDRARDVEISKLVLEGRDAEADALRTAFGLYDRNYALRQSDYELLVRDAERQQHINELLSQRERITQSIRSVIDGTRDSFEQFLVDLPNRGIGAAGDFLKNLQGQAQRLIASRITESIFGGSEARVKSLVNGRNSVDQAIYKFNGSIGQADQGTTRLVSSFGKVETATDKLVSSFEAAASRIAGVKLAVAAPGADGVAGVDLLGGALTNLSGPNGIGKIAAATKDLSNAAKSIETSVDQQAEVTVRAARTRDTSSNIAPIGLPGVPSILEAAVAPLLTKVFGKGFTNNIGKAVGTALQGSAIGSTAAGLVLGSSANQTGASIGGGIGGLIGSELGKTIPIPGIGLIGSVFGGLLGGLFRSTPKAKGTAITSVDNIVTARGSREQSADIIAASKSVQSGIQNIADALGADTGAFSVSIAKYKDSYRVDPTGSGSDGGKYGDRFGVTKFDNNDAEGAVRFAISDAIADGAIKGIRDTTQRILKSGQDLDRALRKAVSFEQVFRDLKARTDPLGAAVDEVNRKFESLKKTFIEANATAQEFADLTKLYELERADAIKSATQQATSAIDQYLKDLAGGSSSPLNKRTVYQNAADEIGRFRTEIASGKIVDQNELLSAARNYQDASRNLFGSSSSFFSDFESLRQLLTTARDNASPTRIDALPTSPFANDPAVQAKLAELTQGQIDATNTQTQILSKQLSDLINIFETDVYRGGSAIDLLPGFNGYPELIGSR